MSHWSRVKTNINNMEILECAAKKLGCSISRNSTARGYKNMALKGEMVIAVPGSPYDVAVNRNEDGTLSLTTDWYLGYVAKVLGPDFGRLKQQYALEMARKRAAILGAAVTEETMSDGTVRMRIRGV
ncbi:DUF1257 domain-containing protein [Desulfoscipio geothermicus]|uniref:DUF1257 domain-containing protein n=1 Tax=Desulfoscipio geothermicus DSM 3669 TaxID=1121426 RepID=A0A1I6E4I3_9FIRM|nr:DUF1257 domain-containing protein [Desulfoscipio geothermicus]SFR12461.1 Protein of unknown function [Desulfoscipio geothermicus DSM 3669]